MCVRRVTYSPIVMFFLAALGGSLALAAEGAPSPAMPAPDAPGVGVYASDAETEDGAAAEPDAEADVAHSSGEFDCLIVPSALVELGVEVQGVIETIHVDHGERVERGQTLATMRAAVERANLEQALDRVTMDSEIEAREADLEFTRQVLERQRSLHAQQLAPQQNVDEAWARHRVAEAALRRARDNAVLDRHELLRHEALFRQRFVVSPIDGVVVRRHAEPGELVIDTPVLSVADLDTLRVDVVLPASELNRFDVGDRAVVRPETAPESDVEAVVTAVDPMLDAASGTFGVRLTLDNGDGTVVAGQECRVRFVAVTAAG